MEAIGRERDLTVVEHDRRDQLARRVGRRARVALGCERRQLDRADLVRLRPLGRYALEQSAELAVVERLGLGQRPGGLRARLRSRELWRHRDRGRRAVLHRVRCDGRCVHSTCRSFGSIGLRLSVVEHRNLLRPIRAAAGFPFWQPWHLAYSAAWAIGGLAISALLFHRSERRFAEAV